MAELMYKIANEEAPDLRLIRPNLPEQLVQIVARVLSKKPEVRYQDGDQLALDLKAVAAALASGPAPARAATPMPAVQPIVTTAAAEKTLAFRQPAPEDDVDKTVIMAFNNAPGGQPAILPTPPAGSGQPGTFAQTQPAFAATVPASALPGYDAGQKETAAPQFDKTSVVTRPGGNTMDGGGKTGQEP
jgi:serine/threonine-protein kinase